MSKRPSREWFLDCLAVASEFYLMADETTDVADWAELTIFVCYVDSNMHSLTEELLGLIEIVRSKSAEVLCEKICEVLKEKGVDVSLMRFNGFDSTNTMSWEISGLQRRLCHICLHSKYINCKNHQLALVFVHLISKHICLLRKLMHPFMAVWKFMRYSSVKAAIFGTTQFAEGQKNLKLLKTAPTWWLTHREVSKCLVSRMESLINALDTIITNKSEPESKDYETSYWNLITCSFYCYYCSDAYQQVLKVSSE